MDVRPVAEAGAAAALVGSLVKVLPAVAALFAVAWYCVCLWESRTGQAWRARWRRLLHRRPLAVEDKVAFLFLGLSAAGAALALVAVSRVLP